MHPADDARRRHHAELTSDPKPLATRSGEPLTLEIPNELILPDGTTARVRTVTATVTDGHVDQVVYTVEKASGAWLDVIADATPTLAALTTGSP